MNLNLSNVPVKDPQRNFPCPFDRLFVWLALHPAFLFCHGSERPPWSFFVYRFPHLHTGWFFYFPLLICLKRITKATPCRGCADGRKTQGEYERAWSHSNSNRGRWRERRPWALLFPGKIAALQILRPESAGYKQNLERVAVVGKQAPPSASLSKSLFDKLSSPLPGLLRKTITFSEWLLLSIRPFVVIVLRICGFYPTVNGFRAMGVLLLLQYLCV